jgi:NTP pyrophosphatase (non-canonical NTP hydrolase)
MRKGLKEFAEKQELKLKENDFKSGWENCSNRYLINRAFQEFLELRDAVIWGKGSIEDECLDVANFVMMLADNNKK